MSEPSVPSAPGNDTAADSPGASSADESTARRTSFPWPARVALVAAAGLVVGGAAFTAYEVVTALDPPDPLPAVAEDEDESPSERRTTPLTGTAQPEDAEADGEEQAAESAGEAPARGPGDAAGTSGGAAEPGGGGASPGALSEGDPGWVDPRKEILEEMLNTPQDRPPMEPQITQEELDALREAAEADVVVQVPELDYSEFYEVAPDTRP
ncbi:hypothetical protein [Nocardiopsis ganjiahuensis]|uniref:hypothetical protein n=1 Tax=Nocardiopsis ganjiahuensis TaxID=239984 RepID=UPI000349E3B1|nr:hypothetical protein [Nocardiopsis ganjiahuensis]